MELTMKPTIGRIVVYKTTEDDRKLFEAETTHWTTSNKSMELPAMIVAVWGDTCINVQVIKDGVNSTMWKTSIVQGDQEGNWNWPTINKE